MSDPWGSEACSAEDKLAAVRQRIQQVAAVGVEIVNQLAAPVEPGMKRLRGARTRIAKALLSPAQEEMAHLQEAAQSVADGSPQMIAAPAAQAVEVVVDNRGRDGSQERHDTDQPDLLIIADADQEWHRKLRAWYNGELDSVLLSPSLLEAIAAREREAQRRRAENPALFSLYVQDVPLG